MWTPNNRDTLDKTEPSWTIVILRDAFSAIMVVLEEPTESLQEAAEASRFFYSHTCLWWLLLPESAKSIFTDSWAE